MIAHWKNLNTSVRSRCVFATMAGLLFLLYLPVLHPLLFGDAFKILGVYQHPASGTFNFWWDIFTSPNNGPQYRPYSYMAHYSLLRTLFGLNLELFHLISFFLFLAAGYQFYKYLESGTQHKSAKWLGVILFLLSPHFLRHVGYFVFTPKYVFPMFCLFYTFNQIHLFGRKNTTWIVVRCILANAFAITNHEAAFVFFALQLVEVYRTRPGFFRPAIPLAIPGVTYFCTRLFLWKIPHAGFMSLDLYNAPSRLLILLGTSWNTGLTGSIGETQPWQGAVVLCLGLLASAVFLWRLKEPHIAQLFATCVLLALPFSMLFDHFMVSRAAWAYVFFIAFIVVIYDALLILAPHKRRWIFAAMAIYLVTAVMAFVRERGIEQQRFAARARDGAQVLAAFEKQLPRGKPHSAKVVIKKSFKYSEESYVIETLLGYYYPHSTFYVENEHADTAAQLVHKGVAYTRYQSATQTAQDIFGTTLTLRLPPSRKTLIFE